MKNFDRMLFIFFNSGFYLKKIQPDLNFREKSEISAQ